MSTAALCNFYTLRRAHCIPRSAAVVQRLSLCLCARSPVLYSNRNESNRVSVGVQVQGEGKDRLFPASVSLKPVLLMEENGSTPSLTLLQLKQCLPYLKRRVGAEKRPVPCRVLNPVQPGGRRRYRD